MRIRTESRVRRFVWTWTALLVVAGLGWTWHTIRDLPAADEIRSSLLSRYPAASRARWVPLWRISPRLQQAVVTWEDPRFFSHRGINFRETARALLADIRAGAYVRGGSTITQQVAKNLFLTREKTLRRKLREWVLARRIEQALTKHEILEIYLNIAEWGPDIQGAEAASRYWFSKPATELEWAEAALLAGMLQNPHRLDPGTHPEEARRKQVQVLVKLLRLRKLSASVFSQAVREGIQLRTVPEPAPVSHAE